MAIFNRWSLTRGGMALITKAQAGKCNINFTKLETGNGVWGNDIVDATALKAVKQTFAFSGIDIPAANLSTVVLEAVLNNRGLEQLYYLREMGIYATDPDEGIILYAIAVADEDTTYLPANNGVGISTIIERINIEVVNADSVTIDTTGAVVAASDFLALKRTVQGIDAGIKGGSAGQHLVKTGADDYAYAWGDTPVLVGAYDNFPKIGAADTVYIDSGSSSIYVWEDGAYKKLSLGADAAENLQAQVTANRKAIAAVEERAAALETAAFARTDVTVLEAGWAGENDGVYTQEIAVTGLTENTALTVWPRLTATTTDGIITEQKAQSVFFGHGKAYADAGKLILKCYGKRPAADFGITLQGVQP